MLPTGPLAKLAANPNATSIYKISKAQKKLLLNEPEWDVPAGSVKMKAFIQGRANAEVLEQHQKKREEAKTNAVRNQKRMDEVRKLQEDYRKKFIDINNFICECERKEAIVAKKIVAEEEKGEKLDAQLAELRSENEKMQKEYDEILKEIEELKVYDDVLQKVVDKSDLFTSKQDFMDKIDALMLTHSEVAENDEETLKIIEELQKENVKATNEAQIVIAGLENEINELQKEYEKAVADLRKWESIIPPTKELMIEKEREARMMIDQIQQLYELLCERSGVEPIFGRDQVEEQLDFISTEFEILVKVIELAKIEMALEDRSDIAEHGSGKSGKPRK